MTIAIDLFPSSHASAHVNEDIETFIRSEAFPCAGAKSALSLAQVTVLEAGKFDLPRNNSDLYQALCAFGETIDPAEMPFRTFICVFEAEPVRSEAEFEDLLWQHLQVLHERDVSRGIGWAEGVASDPTSANFNISVNGVPYFVVGLHPGSSRPARQFGRPAMVFNSAEQFDALRADGRYQALQKIIRERELANTGSINPMLRDQGQGAQASQYSGRHVGEDWECPFKYKAAQTD